MKALRRWLLLAACLTACGLASAQASYDDIRRAQAGTGNWLTYSGNYQGHRHSALAQIDKSNIARLRPAWAYQMRDRGKVQTSPIVVGGVLYITEKPNVVTALDGRTGRPLWMYRRPLAPEARGCCGKPNRGLAILNDALFLATFDGQLVALDRHTGKPRWEVNVADPKQGYTMTGAPLALKDRVIVGVAGGDFGIRGFLDAYDARTGARLWRLWTVPAPGEPGNESWAGDSWKTGGAPTWMTGSYDPQLNLLYWGTGNPGPDWNGDGRAGDNLYSDSLLALDADTGKLRWHFQFTPHDVHDRDANQVPVLIDGMVKGQMRKLVVTANRNGFYYVLDRESGEFLSGTPFVKQTWARSLDARGRPVLLPNTAPTAEGTLIYPGGGGATNWISPSFSPASGLFYVSAFENYPQVFYKMDTPYQPGRPFEGGATSDIAGFEPEGALKALDALTGRLRWQFKLHAPSYVGVLSTAGGLVFGGSSEGNFFALDADTGQLLWHFQTGGEMFTNPVSYMVAGKQHVVITAGLTLFVFALD